LESSKLNNRIPLFCFVTLVFWFSMYTCVPILTAYLKDLGASNRMAGLIVGMYGLSQMLLRIPVGVLSDKFHKRKVFILFGLIFSILSGAGILISQNVTWILILRALAGAAAATWVDFTILFTSYFLKEETSKAIGTISFYNMTGQMLGILCGGWFADQFSWQSSFLIGAVVGGAGLLAGFFIVEHFDEKAQSITTKAVLQVASDKVLLTVSFLAILSQLLTFATVFGFTPVFAQSLGATKFDMGLLTFFSTCPSAIAAWVGGGYLTYKFGEKKVVIAGFVLTGIFTLSIPFTSSIWMLILTQALAGIGRGIVNPILMSLSIKDVDPGKRSTAMGFYQAIYGLGMFVGPLMMGIIGDWLTLKQGFILIGLVGCITAGLSQIMIKEAKASNKMTA
jgi:MFS family permease